MNLITFLQKATYINHERGKNNMNSYIKEIFHGNHKPKLMAADFFKYIGPGFLITIGFIDPGNWATNISAGSSHGNTLLWVITLSTIKHTRCLPPFLEMLLQLYLLSHCFFPEYHLLLPLEWQGAVYLQAL